MVRWIFCSANLQKSDGFSMDVPWCSYTEPKFHPIRLATVPTTGNPFRFHKGTRSDAFFQNMLGTRGMVASRVDRLTIPKMGYIWNIWWYIYNYIIWYMDMLSNFCPLHTWIYIDHWSTWSVEDFTSTADPLRWAVGNEHNEPWTGAPGAEKLKSKVPNEPAVAPLCTDLATTKGFTSGLSILQAWMWGWEI